VVLENLPVSAGDPAVRFVGDGLRESQLVLVGHEAPDQFGGTVARPNRRA